MTQDRITQADLKWWLTPAAELESTFAKPYAEAAPHHYVVENRTPGVTHDEMVRAARVINTFGQSDNFSPGGVMTAEAATELWPSPVLSLGVHADPWLEDLTAVSPDRPIVWCPHGYRPSGTAVRNMEHLSVLVSSLPEPGEWGVVEWSDGDVRRWRQTMRYPTGWVVDAHDGTPDDFAKRVYRGGPGDYPKPSGRRPAFYFELWQPYAAADLMWTWLHGSLPVGCSRTMRHMISEVHDHGLG